MPAGAMPPRMVVDEVVGDRVDVEARRVPRRGFQVMVLDAAIDHVGG